jgi:hypothetical protein
MNPDWVNKNGERKQFRSTAYGSSGIIILRTG